MNPRLDKVQERLEQALARIDSALAAPQAAPDSAEELHALTQEHAVLRDRYREIGGRLDSAINRLQRVLKD